MPASRAADPQGADRAQERRPAGDRVHRPAHHHRYPEPAQPDGGQARGTVEGQEGPDLPDQEEVRAAGIHLERSTASPPLIPAKAGIQNLPSSSGSPLSRGRADHLERRSLHFCISPACSIAGRQKRVSVSISCCNCGGVIASTTMPSLRMRSSIAGAVMILLISPFTLARIGAGNPFGPDSENQIGVLNSPWPTS